MAATALGIRDIFFNGDQMVSLVVDVHSSQRWIPESCVLIEYAPDLPMTRAKNIRPVLQDTIVNIGKEEEYVNRFYSGTC